MLTFWLLSRIRNGFSGSHAAQIHQKASNTKKCHFQERKERKKEKKRKEKRPLTLSYQKRVSKCANETKRIERRDAMLMMMLHLQLSLSSRSFFCKHFFGFVKRLKTEVSEMQKCKNVKELNWDWRQSMTRHKWAAKWRRHEWSSLVIKHFQPLQIFSPFGRTKNKVFALFMREGEFWVRVDVCSRCARLPFFASTKCFFDQSDCSIWRWRSPFVTNPIWGKWVCSSKDHLSGNTGTAKLPPASKPGGDKSFQIKKFLEKNETKILW